MQLGDSSVLEALIQKEDLGNYVYLATLLEPLSMCGLGTATVVVEVAGSHLHEDIPPCPDSALPASVFPPAPSQGPGHGLLKASQLRDAELGS